MARPKKRNLPLEIDDKTIIDEFVEPLLGKTFTDEDITNTLMESKIEKSPEGRANIEARKERLRYVDQKIKESVKRKKERETINNFDTIKEDIDKGIYKTDIEKEDVKLPKVNENVNNKNEIIDAIEEINESPINFKSDIEKEVKEPEVLHKPKKRYIFTNFGLGND